MYAKSRTAPALWRFGNGRELEGGQNSRSHPSGAVVAKLI